MVSLDYSLRQYRFKASSQQCSHQIPPCISELVRVSSDITSLRRFELGFLLGEGNFGSVFKGTARGLYSPGSVTTVAVKVVKDCLDANHWRTIVSELKILSNLEPQYYLVNLLAGNTSRVAEREIYLLLEYCPFGDLKTFLRDKVDLFEGSLNNKPGKLKLKGTYGFKT